MGGRFWGEIFLTSYWWNILQCFIPLLAQKHLAAAFASASRSTTLKWLLPLLMIMLSFKDKV